jgi:hypothetical protein
MPSGRQCELGAYRLDVQDPMLFRYSDRVPLSSAS